jgi:hypothetical protein
VSIFAVQHRVAQGQTGHGEYVRLQVGVGAGDGLSGGRPAFVAQDKRVMDLPGKACSGTGHADSVNGPYHATCRCTRRRRNLSVKRQTRPLVTEHHLTTVTARVQVRLATKAVGE